jgi:predicted component of type VI protein secretion system
MYILRLFQESDPFNEVESRELCEGELTIGRGADVGWTIPDPQRTISRRHCVLTIEGPLLTLQDVSANGVFLGVERVRAPADAAAPLAHGEMVRFGRFMIVVEAASLASKPHDHAFDAPFSRPILADVEVNPAVVTVPTNWADTPAPRLLPSDGSLLDAFCEGAKLDASLFAGEDPAVIMRRLGATYQQMVLGLIDLMGERTSLKSGYRMDRTRVGARDNNPFKWMSGQKLAVDLLRAGHNGFLSGPEAVSASFADLKKHLLCMFWGMRAAIRETLDALSPNAVAEGLKGQAFMLRGKAHARWAEYDKRHTEIRREATDDPNSALNRAFVAAYQARLEDLDVKWAHS